MHDLRVQKKEYQCEDCLFFDDGPVPGECRKGSCKVAYFHQACDSFKFQVKENVNDFCGETG
jgi:hypothetical protein